MDQPAQSISTRQGYDLWAETYVTEKNPLLALQERTLAPLMPNVRGLNVLDIGCGTGRWSKRMAAQRPGNLLGVDVSERMLRQASAALSLNGHLVCAESTSLPVRSGWADLILCSLALDHISDVPAFARELGRVAAVGGTVVISEFHPAAHARGWKRSFRSGGQTFVLAVTPHTLSEIQEAFTEHGFEVVTCAEPCFEEPERAVFLELGREDLFDSTRTAGPALFHLFLRHRRRDPSCSAGAAGMRFCLHNARVDLSATESASASVVIEGGYIDTILHEGAVRAESALDLQGFLILPGLVNAHDHLEFALFPRLGRGPYESARDWAADIHATEKTLIDEHLRVPKDVRLWWGGLKNLLSGVTTVQHHNAFVPDVFNDDFPVRVADCGWAHSFAFEPDVAAKYAATPEGAPFIIHLGEGIDESAREEFSQFKKACGLGHSTVLVHGVALDMDELAELERAGGAIVWCPTSNTFLLNRTLTPGDVCCLTRVALATDSPISGSGDLFTEMAAARQVGVPAQRIYKMVTCGAANVLQADGGRLAPGGAADLIALRDHGMDPADALLAADLDALELVIVRGRVRLVSPALLQRWPAALSGSFEKIVVDGIERYVDAPVGRLLAAARAQLGPEVRVGHKRVWQ